jgi:hypothetical protein
MFEIKDRLISLIKHRIRSMTGGLHFGRPNWRVNSWIFDPAEASADSAQRLEAPTNREQLLEFLHNAGLMQRTCGWTPSLFEHLAALRNRKVQLLIINLIPQMPESILPAVMTQFEFPTMAAGINVIRACLGRPPTIAAMDHHDHRSIGIWRRGGGGGGGRAGWGE